MSELRKMRIVNLLGRRLGHGTYLELATPSTGGCYSEVDRGYFQRVVRMMYVTPTRYHDGMPVDFRTPDEDLFTPMQEFRVSIGSMDVCLVDGWHTYRTAHRDLVEMFDILSDGGVLVVHDCLPWSREGASPRFRDGEWWGTTYKAFLDFVLQTPSLDYLTVDTDHGCGVIIKNRRFETVLGPDAPQGWLPSRPTDDLVAKWHAAGMDFDLAYSLYDQHRTQLMRPISASVFMATFAPGQAVEPRETDMAGPEYQSAPDDIAWVLRPRSKGGKSRKPELAANPRFVDLILWFLRKKLALTRTPKP